METNNAAVAAEEPTAAAPIPIFAWDLSGSTSGVTHYHAVGAKYLTKFLAEHSPKTSKDPAPIFLTWEDHAHQVTLDRLRQIIGSEYGCGGNTTSCIITWIQKNLGCSTPISLWLVTDGELMASDLAICSRLNHELNMNYVAFNFIIISRWKINMSVGAAFFSGSKIKIFMNEDLLKEIDTSEPFDYDKVHAANFDTAVPELSDYIQAKFMGTELQGLAEADKLHKLRLRLFAEIDKQEEHTEAQIKDANKSDHTDWTNKEMMEWLRSTKYYRNLKDFDVASFRTKVDSAISTLVNYIHNKNKSCQFFDILKMDYKQDKVGFAQPVKPDLDIDLESLEDLPEKCSFFDAVTLEVEQSTPVLLLQITDLIDKFWVNGNYTKFRRVADCPLFGQFEECMGHVFSIETVKQLFHNGYSKFRNPMTNKPCYGGLIPHPSFDDWNDYLLMITFFRGKNIRTCPALFYYRIWKYATGCEWLDDGVVTLLEQYALRRISVARTRLAFGSLAMDPVEVVPLPLTLFYCAEGSSLLFAQDSQLFLNDRLRQYYPVSRDLIHIMEKLGVSCDPEFISGRAVLFTAVSLLKTAGNQMSQKYALLSRIFRKQGKFITYEVNDYVDGDPSVFPIKFLALLNYSHKSLIPFSLPKVDLYDHVHIAYDAKLPLVPIFPETLRPKFIIQDQRKGKVIPNYKEILACVTQVSLKSSSGKRVSSSSNRIAPTKLDQTKLLSLNKLYINCVCANNRYPSLAEFEDFVWKEKRFYGDKVYLFPPQVQEFIRQVFDNYQDFAKELGVDEFIKRGTAGVSIIQRLELEGVTNAAVKNATFIEKCRKKWLV